MKNHSKEYWKNFYKNSNFKINTPSNFSLTINNWLRSNNYHPLTTHIVDLGCGNGRDSLFFLNQGYKVTGWDNSTQEYLGNTLIRRDILSLNIPSEVYYARFFFHAISEETLDNLLEILEKKLMSNTSILCFETRSSRGITDQPSSPTNFKSSIGEKHFRMLYSYEYLKKKIASKFTIEYSREGKGYSIYKEDNPFIIRMILKIKV